MDLLFDLDGTLTDSAPGMMRCISMRCRGSVSRLHRAVSRPASSVHLFHAAFAELLTTVDERTISRAIALYRETSPLAGDLQTGCVCKTEARGTPSSDVLDATQCIAIDLW